MQRKVYVLIYATEGNETKVLVGRNINPYQLTTSYFGSLPGGTVNPNEDFVTALRRECWEEIGYHLEPAKIITLGSPLYTYHVKYFQYNVSMGMLRAIKERANWRSSKQKLDQPVAELDNFCMLKLGPYLGHIFGHHQLDWHQWALNELQYRQQNRVDIEFLNIPKVPAGLWNSAEYRDETKVSHIETDTIN